MSPRRKDRMSRMNRRAFITLLGGTAIACPRVALAQSYPARPITMIVPFPAGGGADVLVRILTKHMADDLGQVIVVQNQPGAGGAIAFGQLARAAPDGYTLVLGTQQTHATNVFLVKNLQYDPVKDFVPIAQVSALQHLLVTRKDLGPKNLKEFVEMARAKQDGLIVHTAGFDGNVFRIFDVWESEAHWTRFRDETLMPAVEKMMADNPTGPPPARESTYELHDILPD